MVMEADLLQSVANDGDTSNSDRDTVHEGSPLLKSSSSHQSRVDNRDNSKYVNIYLLLTIVAGIDFSMFMLSLPLTRVYEGITCYGYYAAHEPGRFKDPASIPETLCKLEDIQEELAIVKGYEALFISLPGSCTPIPPLLCCCCVAPELTLLDRRASLLAVRASCRPLGTQACPPAVRRWVCCIGHSSIGCLLVLVDFPSSPSMVSLVVVCHWGRGNHARIHRLLYAY